MRLADAASYFDKLVCKDAYGPATFRAQLDLYDDAKREGLTVQRRILSVAPGVAIPARRVITFGGDQWLMGAREDDSFNGAAVRNKYILHRAGGLAALQTPGQALSSGGTTAYAARMWVKDSKEISESSKLEGFFNLFLAATEAAEEGTFITLGGRVHRARNAFVSVGGFLEAECSEIPAGVVTGTYRARTGYNAGTDTETLAAGVAANVLRLRWQDSFRYANKGAEKYEPGDIKALVRKAVVTAAAPGDQLTLVDGAWSVLSVETESDCWGLHARHV
jgi:hypothetical protein